jgi:trehalose synthase-fused probable maltokinase
MPLEPPPDRPLGRQARAFGPEWLGAQRWFRRKGEGVARVELDAATPLGDGIGWLLVLVATGAMGSEDRYLVPAVEDADGFREPRDGEGVWQRLASLIAAGGQLGAGATRFAFRPVPALGALLPGGALAIGSMAERRLMVEQSNTSVALGDQLLLKVHRLLEPGTSTEAEVNEFLAAVRFDGAPTLGGLADYAGDDDEPSPAVMLQEFVTSESDAWSWVQRCLSGGPGDPTDAIRGVAEIGSLTRDLHRALASRPETPGFPSRAANGPELVAWHSRAEAQLDGALAALRGEAHEHLLSVAPAIRDRLRAILVAGDAQATRIHGDYHLGQLLRTATGFKVIDFGGEPARPVSERREPSSPLRDVAGMLRSLDYAARVAARAGGFEETAAWLREAREAFLSGYGGVSGRDQQLLDAFEVEKACYEVRYEANNRPDWVWLPVGALEHLASGD